MEVPRVSALASGSAGGVVPVVPESVVTALVRRLLCGRA